MEQISALMLPASQILLTLCLFWVAVLFLKLDKKLNDMKKGTDGIKDTIIELNQTIATAQNAINNLKLSTKSAQAEIDEKLEDAKFIAEKLAFLASAAKAIQNAPPPVQASPQASYSDPIFDEPFAKNTYAEEEYFEPAPKYARRRQEDFEKEASLDFKGRDLWGALR